MYTVCNSRSDFFPPRVRVGRWLNARPGINGALRGQGGRGGEGGKEFLSLSEATEINTRPDEHFAFEGGRTSPTINRTDARRIYDQESTARARAVMKG